MAALTIEQGIGCSFADVPSVKGVYVLNRADVLNVFTIVDTDDEDAFDAIYDRARLVIGRFPDFILISMSSPAVAALSENS